MRKNNPIFKGINVTVEKLAFAGMGLRKAEFNKRNAEVISYFDLFKKAANSRLNRQASYLSGGEQHQLALTKIRKIRVSFGLMASDRKAGCEMYLADVSLKYK